MSSATSVTPPAPAAGNRPSWLQRFSFFGVNPGVMIGFLVMVVALYITTPTFRQIATMQNLAQQVSLNAIIAVGMTFVIITAGIDLSVGSILGLVGTATAMALLAPSIVGHIGLGAMGVAVAIGLAVGAGVGFLNGMVISSLKMQPFIVTLATMWAVRGFAEVLTDGSPIGMVSDDAPFAAFRNDMLQHHFNKLGTGYIPDGSPYGIPISAIIAIVVIVAAHLLLSRTIFGRHVYALGGNAEAARLSGVNIDRVKLLVYTLSGLLSGIAAILLMSKLVSGQPTAGQGYELYAIAAVVVGGTSLFGGSGSVIGSVIGALIIGVINMGLDLHQVSAFYQQIVTGAIILIAVLLDNVLRRRAG